MLFYIVCFVFDEFSSLLIATPVNMGSVLQWLGKFFIAVLG